MGTVKEVGYSKQVRYGKKGGVKIKKSITGKVCLSVCLSVCLCAHLGFIRRYLIIP